MARHIPKPIRCRTHWRVLAVPSLAMLGVTRGRRCTTIDIRHVALAQLARVRVHRQCIGVVDGLDRVAAAEQRAEFVAVARRVVVGGRGAEALLLLAVAAEGELGYGRDYEEDTEREKR